MDLTPLTSVQSGTTVLLEHPRSPVLQALTTQEKELKLKVTVYPADEDTTALQMALVILPTPASK